MDENRFDQLTRTMASKTSRRSLLKGMLAALASTALDEDEPSTGILAAPNPDRSSPLLGTQALEVTRVSYFALGDSIASGHGLNDSGGECHRSPSAYPYHLARQLQNADPNILVRFNDSHLIACSGQPSTDLTYQVNQLRGKLAIETKQGLVSPSDPIVVSISAGINDIWGSSEKLASTLSEIIFAEDAFFASWVNAQLPAIKENLRTAIGEIIAMGPNTSVVVTGYYNPLNELSIFFAPFPQRCLDGSCNRRADRLIELLNNALSQVTLSFGTEKVQFVGSIADSFKGHEGPRPLCGLAPPDRLDSWIQSPFLPDYNSISSLAGFAALPFTGDCLHPGYAGARAIASLAAPAALSVLDAVIVKNQPGTALSTSDLSRGNCSGSLCDDECVDLGSDPFNCGQCGRTCPSGECVNGRCIGGATCREPRVLCGASCRDLQSNPLHCSTCGNDCEGNACINGVCQDAPSECGAGLTMCAEVCVNLTSDDVNCGECGHVCSGSLCIEGDCLADLVCQEDSDCPAGSCCGDECVDTMSSNIHCGSCGEDSSCRSDEACVQGMCQTVTQAALTIRTVNEHGVPLAGACYRVHQGWFNGSPDLCSDGHAPGNTDVVILTLSPGYYIVQPSIAPPGYVFSGSQQVEIIEGQSLEITMTMTSSATLEVSIVNSEGLPVAGACMVVMQNWSYPGHHLSWQQGGGCDSDFDGHLVFPGLSPISTDIEDTEIYYTLDVSQQPPGYYLADVDYLDGKRIQPAALETISITITAEDGSSINAIVLDPYGEPLVNTCVEIAWLNSNGQWQSGPNSCDYQDGTTDGYIRTRSLTPGPHRVRYAHGGSGTLYYEGVAYEAGYLVPVDEYVDVHESDSPQVVLSLEFGGLLAVTTLDFDGNPRSTGSFVLYWDTGSGELGAFANRGYSPEGSFQIDRLATGNYVLVNDIAAEGYPRFPDIPVSISAGRVFQLVLRDEIAPQGNAFECIDPKLECSGSCVHPLTDSNNCGDCGVACLENQTCIEGTCAELSLPVPTEEPPPDEPQAETPLAEASTTEAPPTEVPGSKVPTEENLSPATPTPPFPPVEHSPTETQSIAEPPTDDPPDAES